MHKRQGRVSTFSFKIRYRAWTDPSPVSAFATKSLENVMQGEKQQREEKGFQDEVHVSLLTGGQSGQLMNSGVLSGGRQNPPAKRFARFQCRLGSNRGEGYASPLRESI